MSRRRAMNNVNYQERATEFSVGDVVTPFGAFDAQTGRVTAVWPAIGMIDVEYPSGNKRYPVEDLQRFDDQGNATPPHTDSVPGGQPTVQVPGGPYGKSAARVAAAFQRKAIYWKERDRRYQMSRPELDAGCPNCPKCPDISLKKAIYKRRDGSSEKLMGCPECMFLIKEGDILNHPSAVMVEEY